MQEHAGRACLPGGCFVNALFGHADSFRMPLPLSLWLVTVFQVVNDPTLMLVRPPVDGKTLNVASWYKVIPPGLLPMHPLARAAGLENRENVRTRMMVRTVYFDIPARNVECLRRCFWCCFHF